jgi:hypothetical protein
MTVKMNPVRLKRRIVFSPVDAVALFRALSWCVVCDRCRISRNRTLGQLRPDRTEAGGLFNLGGPAIDEVRSQRLIVTYGQF